MGPGKLKSKPRVTIIWASRSMSCSLLTYFFSSSLSKLIILVKLGEIGYSSLADISTEIVAKQTICDLGKFEAPII